MIRYVYYQADGWEIQQRPHEWDAGDANLLAHDILEHRPHPDGSVLEELEALGALIYVRAQDWRTSAELARALQGDLEVLYTTSVGDFGHVDGIASEYIPPRTRELPTRDEAALQLLGRDGMSDNFHAFAKGAMRAGYWYAAQRYERYPRDGMLAVRQALVSALRAAEGDLCPGTRVRLSIDLSVAKVTVRVDGYD